MPNHKEIQFIIRNLVLSASVFFGPLISSFDIIFIPLIFIGTILGLVS